MTQSALEDLEVIHSILIILWIILFKSGTYDSFWSSLEILNVHGEFSSRASKYLLCFTISFYFKIYNFWITVLLWMTLKFLLISYILKGYSRDVSESKFSHRKGTIKYQKRWTKFSLTTLGKINLYKLFTPAFRKSYYLQKNN